MIRPMRLQMRLFLWFIAAVVSGALASAAVVFLTQRDPSDRPASVMARTVSAQVASRWDDPAALEAYVREVRDATGIGFQVVRDPAALPDGVVRASEHNNPIVFRPDVAYVPVSKNGVLVGAVTFKTGGPPGRWYRPVASIVVSLIVFAFAARRVSKQIAAPLERVAAAADRLGAGDLTARAGVEEHAGTEALRVGGAFDAMAARVEHLVRDQRELLAAVSHELRSPLGRARVALEIARERDDGGKALDKLEEQLGGVDRILGDLLDVTRSGLTDLHKKRIDLAAWLENELGRDEASIVVHGELAVLADPAMLGRVVHNLVDNARRHGHPDSEPVLIDVVAHGNHARVAVRDHGGGFPADVIDRAFDPFVRGDPARSPKKHDGAGLGLAIVKSIVVAHGGSVGAKNVSPRGAEVWFELPLAVA